MQNPRVLLLFRFVSDVMGALSIISSAAKQTEDEAGATGAASAAAGAPAAGAAAEAVKGAAAAAGDAAAAAATGEAAATPPPARSDPPLEVLIELHNLGVVLPTTAYSSSTLGATVEHLLIALPGGSDLAGPKPASWQALICRSHPATLAMWLDTPRSWLSCAILIQLPD